MIRILHITDLHFTNKIGGRTKQQKLIENYLNDLEQNVKEVDFVIFSGDLVSKGSEFKDFELAGENFLLKTIEYLNTNKTNLFICPGNHDVDRNNVSRSVVKYLDEEVNNNDKLNDFFRNDNPDLIASHKPLSNYRKFVKKYFDSNNSDDHVELMYSIHKRNTKEGKVGFVCFNTAWRSIGINDDNNLLFPLSKIDEALDMVLDCDIKIAIHHHPLNDLKPFNLYDLEDLLHKRFDFMFSGHIHKNSVSMDITQNDGVVKFGSSASLSFDRDSQIGYSLIDIDYEELEFKVNFRMYDKKNEIFYPLPIKKDKIPTTEIKKEQNRLRINIRNRFLEEIENSKSLFVESGSSSESKNLLELSTNPVLKSKSLSEILNDDEQSHPDFIWSDFFKFDKDYIIFGKDKCGKTILLKKIELELLKDFSRHDYMPYYIDLKSWNISNQIFNFEKEFAKYYYINQTVAKKLLEEKKIVLLIDNFHVNDKAIKDKIEKQVTNHDNFKLVLCSTTGLLNTLDNTRFDGRDLNKLYFHRLRKIHIKELTKKNYNLPKDKEEQIVDKINSIFKKLSIPFNYWTVSIFLWVFNKDANNNLHNDVDLINLYIEKLLEKEQLTVTASTFTYNNYKKLLANLAYFLLVDHRITSHYAKYSQIIDFIQKQLDKNPRKSTNPKEIFEYLDGKGLLRKREPDMYSFRLNGVFEYFIAYYMTLDDSFLNKSLNDKNYYLSFANEFELFAGFKRDNIDFLNKIYSITKANFNQLNELYNIKENSIDSLLISKVHEADQLGKLIEKYSNKLKEGLSEAQQDEIEEQMIKEMRIDESHSEVKMKTSKSFSDTAERLEETLKILGKVYRNIDDIDDSDLVYEIFDYIINNACLWSYKLLDEFGEMDMSKILKEGVKGEAQALLKLISSVIPTIVQVRLYDMIGHVNLEEIILNRLIEAKSDSKNNQFKIFIYSFLLLDINYNGHKRILEEVIPLIKIPIIKYSFILKLNYYLGFKNTLTNEDKRFLKNKIQSQYLKFNNRIDVGDVQKKLSKNNKPQ
ncbi:metallophosphoesterase [Mesoflavibacter zeaxanthinifaciens]|uniref:metallophosphoesterase n=1 Tax=Mesoflavibacter zeaxanthinifaciens TaxID=393060 RepID=UPI00041929DA|nr:metallophosphoesterase [Mesoflavibacter zeaxanthinifaciens]